MVAIIWLLVALALAGIVGLAAGMSWVLYLKPKLRRRFERDHHRRKVRQRHSAGDGAKGAWSRGLPN